MSLHSTALITAFQPVLLNLRTARSPPSPIATSHLDSKTQLQAGPISRLTLQTHIRFFLFGLFKSLSRPSLCTLWLGRSGLLSSSEVGDVTDETALDLLFVLQRLDPVFHCVCFLAVLIF